MEIINNDIEKYNNHFLNLTESFLDKKCLRRNYAAIIVKDKNIITYGINSAPNGFEDCVSKNKCLRKEKNIEHGTCYELCNSVHAEQNCIINTDKEIMKDAILYLVGKEYDTNEYIKNIDCCIICKKMIINSGISKVIMRINKSEYKEIDVKNDWKNILD